MCKKKKRVQSKKSAQAHRHSDQLHCSSRDSEKQRFTHPDWLNYIFTKKMRSKQCCFCLTNKHNMTPEMIYIQWMLWVRCQLLHSQSVQWEVHLSCGFNTRASSPRSIASLVVLGKAIGRRRVKAKSLGIFLPWNEQKIRKNEHGLFCLLEFHFWGHGLAATVISINGPYQALSFNRINFYSTVTI